MGTGPEQISLKRRRPNDQTDMERCSASSSPQRITRQSQWDVTARVTHTRLPGKRQVLPKCGGKRTLCMVVGKASVQPPWKAVWSFPKKLKGYFYLVWKGQSPTNAVNISPIKLEVHTIFQEIEISILQLEFLLSTSLCQPLCLSPLLPCLEKYDLQRGRKSGHI